MWKVRRYQFHSDTNQQEFEMDMADFGVDVERTEIIGELVVHSFAYDDLANSYGADPVEGVP